MDGNNIIYNSEEELVREILEKDKDLKDSNIDEE